MTGGVGRERLTEFYRNHFIFQNSPDTENELVSRSIGIDRVIDEFIFKFTHDREIDWLYVWRLIRNHAKLTVNPQLTRSTAYRFES